MYFYTTERKTCSHQDVSHASAELTAMPNPLSPTHARIVGKSSSSLGSNDSGFRSHHTSWSWLSSDENGSPHHKTSTPKRHSANFDTKRRSLNLSESSSDPRVQSQHPSPGHPSYSSRQVKVEESNTKIGLRELEDWKAHLEVQIKQLERDVNHCDRGRDPKLIRDAKLAKHMTELETQVEEQRKHIQELDFEAGRMRHRVKSLEFPVENMQRWMHSAPSSTLSLDTLSICDSEPPPRDGFEEALQLAVVTNLPSFVRYTNWNCLVPYLMAAELVGFDKAEVLLSAHKDRTEKGNYFYIHTLPYAGWDAYRKLYKCLQSEKDHSGHSTLLRILHASKR